MSRVVKILRLLDPSHLARLIMPLIWAVLAVFGALGHGAQPASKQPYYRQHFHGDGVGGAAAAAAMVDAKVRATAGSAQARAPRPTAQPAFTGAQLRAMRGAGGTRATAGMASVAFGVPLLAVSFVSPGRTQAAAAVLHMTVS